MISTEDLYKKTMAIIDEVSGGVIDTTDVDYKAKAPHFITMLQADLMKNAEMYKTYTISRMSIVPKLGLFDFLAHENDDIIKEASGEIKSYHFEVNGGCTVYIEDTLDGTNWSILATITVPTSVNSFTQYKGSITPTSGATMTRIRFSGTYYYNITNIALFNQNFYAIPDYRPYIKYTIPSDFKSVDQIIEEVFPENYIKSVDYYWEGKTDLYLSYDFSGNIRLVYKPIPIAVTLIDAAVYLEIDDITALTVMPYGLASHILLNENQSLANFFETKYLEQKRDAVVPKKANKNQIYDVYDSSLSY